VIPLPAPSPEFLYNRLIDLTTLLQQLINGLPLGNLYPLTAIGYTMVYGILRLINFAHGDLLMVGAYVGGMGMGLFASPWPPAFGLALSCLPLLFHRFLITGRRRLDLPEPPITIAPPNSPALI
jgi:branched-subunit amino acid ABC-type transport system permease component